jgi:ATP-dependent Zn protease
MRGNSSARHLETTKNHNNAIKQVVASHQQKIDLLVKNHKDTKDVAEALLKMKELEAYDPLPEIKCE